MSDARDEEREKIRERKKRELQERLEEKRENIQPDAVPLRVAHEDFTVPPRFRERFKNASAHESEPEPEDTAEDFGIDPDEATYKYDTGR